MVLIIFVRYLISMGNKYVKRSRISEKKFREILQLFCLDIEAKKVSILTGISRVTIHKLFDKMRASIATYCQEQNPLGEGQIEVDESYFGAKLYEVKEVEGQVERSLFLGCFNEEVKCTHR